MLTVGWLTTEASRAGEWADRDQNFQFDESNSFPAHVGFIFAIEANMSLGPTDPKEIIEFLIGSTPEPYPYAKVVALLTFCAWMRWPNDAELVRSAQIAAAATVVVHERENKRSVETPLTVDILCDALINLSLAGTYYDAMEPVTEPVTDIVGFFMHCPEHLKPSLLKARFFIDSGGFVPEDVEEDDEKQYKRSPATMKVVWKEQAVASPFLWAGLHFEDNFDLLDLVPDEVESISIAQNFLGEPERFRTFLGVALYCQNKLLRLLDPAAARFEFLEFPDSIEPITPEIGTFDEAQLAVLGKYQAPI